MWGAIIQAIQKKNDGIKNSLGNLAQTQSAFSGQGTSFNPQMAQMPTAQTNNNNNNQGSIFSGVAQPQMQTQSQNAQGLSPIGQEIQKQTNYGNLYDYLRM